jgi:hypothetical protein
MATAFVWDGAGANNWDTDHWGRGGVAPTYPGDAGSAVGDTIEVDGSVNDPATAPGVLTVAEYTCYGGTFDCGSNLTVTDALTMGTDGGSDAPIFSGTASAGCIVIFQGAADNAGTVDDDVTFNNSSRNNAGTVGDNAIFNDDAYNTGDGTVGDNATFNDSSYNLNGTVGDGATFNSDQAQDDEFSGTTYYLAAPTTFATTAKFTNIASDIDFLITTDTGSLVMDGSNTITNDGGSTNIAYEVKIATQADLAAGNILNGKTILGVEGGLAAGPLVVKSD